MCYFSHAQYFPKCLTNKQLKYERPGLVDNGKMSALIPGAYKLLRISPWLGGMLIADVIAVLQLFEQAMEIHKFSS